jgi:succinate dehydrogenase/fumarate reductase cytochrome b subunit
MTAIEKKARAPRDADRLRSSPAPPAMTSFWRDSRVPLVLRLHSAAGVLPLGAFFALHLWINARATQGRRPYETWVYALQAIPGLPLLEVALIFAPLVFHGLYGTAIVLGWAESLPEPAHTHPWSRSMLRATGVAGFLFVALHVVALRIPALLGQLAPADFFPKLTDDLSATTSQGVPAVAMAYLLGLAATSYHLANGLSRFFLRLPMSENPRTRRTVSLACTAVGSALFLLGANTVVYFATGASLVGSR